MLQSVAFPFKVNTTKSNECNSFIILNISWCTQSYVSFKLFTHWVISHRSSIFITSNVITIHRYGTFTVLVQGKSSLLLLALLFCHLLLFRVHELSRHVTVVFTFLCQVNLEATLEERRQKLLKRENSIQLIYAELQKSLEIIKKLQKRVKEEHMTVRIHNLFTFFSNNVYCMIFVSDIFL